MTVMIVLCTAIAICYQAASVWMKRRRRHNLFARKAAGLGTVAWLLYTAALTTAGYAIDTQVKLITWLCIAELIAFPAGMAVQEFAARRMHHPDDGPPPAPPPELNEPLDDGQSPPSSNRQNDLNDSQSPPPPNPQTKPDKNQSRSPLRQTGQSATAPTRRMTPCPAQCGMLLVPGQCRCMDHVPVTRCHLHHR